MPIEIWPFVIWIEQIMWNESYSLKVTFYTFAHRNDIKIMKIFKINDKNRKKRHVQKICFLFSDEFNTQFENMYRIIHYRLNDQI